MNYRAKVITSLVWKLLERGGTQVIQFIVQIILARLLLPEDYGLLAIVSVFILVANVFVQSGFNTALIQKKEIDEKDLSSVFYLSLVLALILYSLLFISSPYISDFYNIEELELILRVLGITLFLGAFNSVQNAVIARRMEFKKLFYSSIGAIVISGTIGIYTAYIGWGIWALVAQQATNQIIITLILFFIVAWRPKLVFSLDKISVLFSFGWKLLLATLIDTIFMNLRSLIIGKMFSTSSLGFYSRGNQFPSLIVSTINGSIQSVMLPALSSYQDDKAKVKGMMRRSITTSSFLIFPIMTLLAVTAEPLVLILLTEKWLPSVPFIQIFCISYALWPIHTANLQAINALGRSDIYLKLEIIKKILGLIILFISIPFGIYAIAGSLIITGVISTFINAYPNNELLKYGYKEQIRDVLPSILVSFGTGVLVYFVKYAGFGPISTILLQTVLGIVIYYSLAKIFKLEILSYLEKLILSYKKREVK